MSRSYRKQPVWKDHNRGMKAMANRKVRRALNRDVDFELPNSLYKRYFCQYDIVTIVFLFLVALSSFIKVVLETGKSVGIIGSGKISRILREKKFTRIGLIIVVNKRLSPNGYGNSLLSCHNLSSNLSSRTNMGV